MSLQDVAETLLENWSKKDSAAVSSLMSKDAVITAPVAPGGKMKGTENIQGFLDAQNTDRSKFPDEELEYHEMMSKAKLRVTRAIEKDNSVALEVELTSGDGRTVDVAAFMDFDQEQHVKKLKIYFHVSPV